MTDKEVLDILEEPEEYAGTYREGDATQGTLGYWLMRLAEKDLKVSYKMDQDL